jgi:4-hydroxybutyryl-CoA dehydratase / vinylacetyl-CoA-Delta-isomerase
MPLMTGKQYRESLRNRNKMKIFLLGEEIENPVEHPIIKASINSIALTYELAEDPQYSDLFITKSSLTGENINRFCHIHQNTEDLVKKIKMQRLLGQKCGTCFQRCVGMDALNAGYLTSYEIDQKYNSYYHKKFKKYVKMVQNNDWVIDGCMTDPKGDRNKRPHEQNDKDLYFHISERKNDGIIVRGAKAHQTGAINSHEHLIMPTLAMRNEDRDFTIVCAIPADAKGITYYYGRQSCDLRRLDETPEGDIDCGNPKYGGQECLVVFDNVFVPEERIFMNGETDFCSRLVDSFAGYHRQSYACKVGVGDVLIGAAASIAEYNGVERASHIRDKITEMNHLNETLWSGTIACSSCGVKTPAGNYLIDLLLANVFKHNITRFPFEIARILHDIAGGLFVTLPSAKELNDPERGEMIKKYFAGAQGIETLDRIKMLRLIENLVMGRASVGYLTESMHGAGSPQAQRIIINRLTNLDKKKELAKTLANIKEN